MGHRQENLIYYALVVNRWHSRHTDQGVYDWYYALRKPQEPTAKALAILPALLKMNHMFVQGLNTAVFSQTNFCISLAHAMQV